MLASVRIAEAMRPFLFTYGSLQPGKAPAEIADIVAGLEIVGRGFVLGRLQGEGPYPGVVLDEVSGNQIVGTIYRLPDDPEVMRRLDEYEEFFPEELERSEFL